MEEVNIAKVKDLERVQNLQNYLPFFKFQKRPLGGAS